MNYQIDTNFETGDIVIKGKLREGECIKDFVFNLAKEQGYEDSFYGKSPEWIIEKLTEKHCSRFNK